MENCICGFFRKYTRMHNIFSKNQLEEWQEEKRSLGRPRCGEEDNINMDLKEIGSESVDCIHLRIGASDGLL
jgi:hypothetical protein